MPLLNTAQVGAKEYGVCCKGCPNFIGGLGFLSFQGFFSSEGVQQEVGCDLVAAYLQVGCD